MGRTRIGIYGYGNLGRGVECAVAMNKDMELVAVFTRRAPETVQIMTPGVPVLHTDAALGMAHTIDIMILCGGSATDLPTQTPALAQHFCVVDSFDTHAKIPQHYAAVDAVAQEHGTLAVISAGWDPGMFSLNRLYAQAVLPSGTDYTFWGKGVSQGHSDAIRRIDGVADAKQYTVPVQSAVDAVLRGEAPTLATREKHRRECYVVAKEGADTAAIEKAIVTMPNYFADYDTTVHFITAEELAANHAGLPHGGMVLRTGVTDADAKHKHIIEYKLTLDSNPEFTASVLVATARAAHRMHTEGQRGCKTLLDIPPAYLSAKDGDALRKILL